ncbi:hypothetical protein ACILG0_04320 [Pseudomonadota bacterium AL_CKDN230030165-1A_HGKHYDSX7]
MIARLVLLAGVLALTACTEQPQKMQHTDAGGKPLYDGTGSNFMASGWKPGDKNSWQQELKTRAQRGQNEYTKVY